MPLHVTIGDALLRVSLAFIGAALVGFNREERNEARWNADDDSGLHGCLRRNPACQHIVGYYWQGPKLFFPD